MLILNELSHYLNMYVQLSSGAKDMKSGLTLCVPVLKAPARMRICVGLSEPLLFAFAISTKISCAGCNALSSVSGKKHI